MHTLSHTRAYIHINITQLHTLAYMQKLLILIMITVKVTDSYFPLHYYGCKEN